MMNASEITPTLAGANYRGPATDDLPGRDPQELTALAILREIVENYRHKWCNAEVDPRN